MEEVNIKKINLDTEENDLLDYLFQDLNDDLLINGGLIFDSEQPFSINPLFSEEE